MSSKNNAKFFLMCIVLLFTFTTMMAQTGKLSGKITNKQGDPLAGANVVIPQSNIGAASNIRGEFILSGVPAGEQQIKVTYIGYQQKSIDVTIEEGATKTIDIELSSKSIEGQEVEITTQAQGQMSAINQQVTSDNISNVVSSDKIQALPDANAAESIGRLPGVSIQREGGEGNKVGVRGLSPKYNNVKVGGVALPSSNRWDRSADLNMIPSEMLGGIELRKSLTADMDAEAHGGTVNMQLKEAEEGLKYGLDINGGYNDLGNSYTNYKISGTVSNRFFDDQFGVFLQLHHDRKNLPSDQFEASYSGVSYDAFLGQYQIDAQDATLRRRLNTRERTGGSAILDYQSEDENVKIKYFSFYNNLNSDVEERETWLSFNQLETREQRLNLAKEDHNTTMQSHALQNTFNFLNSQLNVNLSYSEADKSISGNDARVEDYPDTSRSLYISNKTFANPDSLMHEHYNLIEPVSPVLAFLQDRERDLVDENTMIDFDWNKSLNITDNISGEFEIGGKYTTKDRSSSHDQYQSLFQWGGGDSRYQAMVDSIKAHKARGEDLPFSSNYGHTQLGVSDPSGQFIDEDYDYGRFLNGRYELGWSGDLDHLISLHNFNYSNFQEAKKRGQANYYVAQQIPMYRFTYDGEESLAAGYFMTKLDIGEKLTLIPGLRYEKKTTSYSGTEIVTTASPSGAQQDPEIDTVDRDNDYLFPSINMKYKMNDWFSIRGAAYKSISRPSFMQISPTVVYEPAASYMYSHNPFLKPSTAWNYDLAFSVNDDKIGLITLNLYYKEIENLIFNMNYYPKNYEKIDFATAPAGIEESLLGKDYFRSAAVEGSYQTDLPVNNPHSTIYKGMELSWQTNFWFLPGAWSGIVLDGNLSLIDSKTKYPYFTASEENSDSIVYKTREEQMFDQPNGIYNLRIGYDYKGFSSRLSFRYQDRTVNNIDKKYGLKNEYTSDLFRMDLSVKQNITENIQIYSNIANINKYTDYTYFEAAPTEDEEEIELPIRREYYGLSAKIGIKYNF